MKSLFSKRKTVILHLVFGVILLAVIVLAFFKYCEEMVSLKSDIYYHLQTAQADSKIDFTEYPSITTEEGEWYQDAPLIYHAGGGIDGLAYSNSQEALEKTLENGSYFVEIDFMYTSDGELICMHEWENQWDSEAIPSLQEFKAGRVYGKYTTMTAKELIGYMAEYPELHIIIDTKEGDQVEVVKTLVELSSYNTDITNRFIIQLYADGVKSEIQEIYPFRDSNYLFTVYKYGDRFPNKIMKICYDENISVVTVPYDAWDEATKQLYVEKGFVLYEHTVNRPDFAEKSLKQGVHGFYTDFLELDDLQAD